MPLDHARSRSTLRTASRLLAFAVPAATVALTALPASATAAPPACGGATVTGSTGTVTCSFTGSLQSFTVPAGVTSVTIDADGAQGGDVPGFDAVGSAGGLGGEATATLDETPGTVLTVLVGGMGYSQYLDSDEHDANGNGYGGGGAAGFRGGQGGGGSFITDAGGDDVLVAGGGGGGGDDSDQPGGSGGGLVGGVGSGNGGSGGTQSAGGAGGGFNGASGSSGTGGDVADPSDNGGGGGGGYFGGGSGSTGPLDNETDGGGGGGSGFGPDSTAFTSGAQAGNGIVTFTYQLASTTTAVSPSASVTAGQPTDFTATVSPTPDTGTVQFAVDGTDVGNPVAVADDGTATSPGLTMPGGSHQVTAIYSGSDGFEGSNGSDPLTLAPVNPTITSSIHSAHPKTHYGWYRSPVVVSFHCAAGSGNLGPCPTSKTVTTQGRNRSVSGAVTADDGGSASTTVGHLNLDRTKPHVHVHGAKSGSTYRARRALKCVASDALSGVASCRISTHRSGQSVHWTATATDKAGNRSSASGHYRIRKP